jgi:predicted RNase H-like HicB family nuclease
MKTEKPIGFRIAIMVEPDEGGFHAYCPALKGLHTCGKTEKEAVKNAKYAAQAYLVSLVKHGDPIPVGIEVRREEQPISDSLKPVTTYHVEDLKVLCAI